jgi:hypothetical protein
MVKVSIVTMMATKGPTTHHQAQSEADEERDHEWDQKPNPCGGILHATVRLFQPRLG